MEKYKIKPHTYSALGSKNNSSGRHSSIGSSKPPRVASKNSNSLTPKMETKGKGLYYVTMQLQLEKPKSKKPLISRNHKKIYEKSSEVKKMSPQNPKQSQTIRVSPVIRKVSAEPTKQQYTLPTYQQYKNQTTKNSQRPVGFFKTATQSSISIQKNTTLKLKKQEQRVASKMKNYPVTVKKPVRQTPKTTQISLNKNSEGRKPKYTSPGGINLSGTTATADNSTLIKNRKNSLSPSQPSVSFKEPKFNEKLREPQFNSNDLLWYAAYDEDINSKIFIEKLQKIGDIEHLLPQKIIPTVMLGWTLKLEFDIPYLTEHKDKMALMKLHLISRKVLLRVLEIKNGKKVPLKQENNGNYIVTGIKKVKYNKVITVTKFQEYPVYVITSDRKQNLTLPTFENKMKQISILNQLYCGLKLSFQDTFVFEKGEIENYMNNIEGRFQDIEENKFNGAYKCSIFCKKMTEIQQKTKISIQYTKKGVNHMKSIEFQPKNGNLGQSILRTPTESSRPKITSLDGSLLDQKMGAKMKKKEEILSDSEQNEIQIMNRFNDHQINNSSLKTLEKLEQVDFNSDYKPVKLFEARTSSQKNLADYFRDVLFLSSEEKKQINQISNVKVKGFDINNF